MRFKAIAVTSLALAAIADFTSSECPAAALIELQSDGKTYEGRLVGFNDRCCWLMDRDGRLNQVQLSTVVKHRAAAPVFERLTTAQLRDRLRREFGREMEIVGTGHYLVCAPQGRAAAYGGVFEGIYRRFHSYFARRNFRIEEPEFPLVAVVLPDHASFAKYARGDDIKAVPGLLGYYHRLSNRVALYDSEGGQQSARVSQSAELINLTEQFAPVSTKPGLIATFADWAVGRREGGSLQDTIVHEATHQAAYNTGLHSRVAEVPLWVVEGLGTAFEAPGIQEDAARTSRASRINRYRQVSFVNFAKVRRKQNSLADFVRSDEPFQTATLDAYSQAWALTFFLLETRPQNYARYLQAMSARDAMKAYTTDERLNDFQQAFGKDLNWLEVEFLRFVERLD